MPAVPTRLLLRSGSWTTAWLLWFALLCFVSSLSRPGPHIDVVGIDKVEHTIYFLAGGLCLGLALALGWLKPRFPAAAADFSPLRMGLILLPLGAAVGWLDEWHQSYTPGRSGLDFKDWIADVTGTALALAFLKPVLRRLSRTVRKA